MYWFTFNTCFNYLCVSRNVFRGFPENNELYICDFWLKQKFNPRWLWMVQNQQQKYYKIVQNLFKNNNKDNKAMSIFIVICWTCCSSGTSISIVDLKQEKHANINMDYITIISSKIVDSESSKTTLLLQKP